MFQPRNVKPVLVKLLVVSAWGVPTVYVSLAIVPEPELALKMTVSPAGDHSAYNAKL